MRLLSDRLRYTGLSCITCESTRFSSFMSYFPICPRLLVRPRTRRTEARSKRSKLEVASPGELPRGKRPLPPCPAEPRPGRAAGSRPSGRGRASGRLPEPHWRRTGRRRGRRAREGTAAPPPRPCPPQPLLSFTCRGSKAARTQLVFRHFAAAPAWRACGRGCSELPVCVGLCVCPGGGPATGTLPPAKASAAGAHAGLPTGRCPAPCGRSGAGGGASRRARPVALPPPGAGLPLAAWGKARRRPPPAVTAPHPARWCRPQHGDTVEERLRWGDRPLPPPQHGHGAPRASERPRRRCCRWCPAQGSAAADEEEEEDDGRGGRGGGGRSSSSGGGTERPRGGSQHRPEQLMVAPQTRQQWPRRGRQLSRIPAGGSPLSTPTHRATRPPLPTPRRDPRLGSPPPEPDCHHPRAPRGRRRRAPGSARRRRDHGREAEQPHRRQWPHPGVLGRGPAFLEQQQQRRR